MVEAKATVVADEKKFKRFGKNLLGSESFMVIICKVLMDVNRSYNCRYIICLR
jgi:hypothetical protein